MTRCCPYALVLANSDLVSRHCSPACLKSQVLKNDPSVKFLDVCMTSSNSAGAEQAGFQDALQAQAASVLSQPCVQDLAASACGQHLKDAVACFVKTREDGQASAGYPVRSSSMPVASSMHDSWQQQRDSTSMFAGSTLFRRVHDPERLPTVTAEHSGAPQQA